MRSSGASYLIQITTLMNTSQPPHRRRPARIGAWLAVARRPALVRPLSCGWIAASRCLLSVSSGVPPVPAFPSRFPLFSKRSAGPRQRAVPLARGADGVVMETCLLVAKGR